MLSTPGLAAQVQQRIDALAQVTDEPGRLTRTYGSPAMRRANDLVGTWMREAGLDVREDAVGNLIGRRAGTRSNAPTLLVGSHLDTVRDAGRFDGPLGVLVAIAAIAAIEHVRHHKVPLPFAIEVIAFADEEGVRFQSTYLGSRAIAGTLTNQDLARTDSAGITMAEAIRRFVINPTTLASARREASGLLGYVEVHIEQGPVLEQLNQAVGVVTGIAGQTRAKAIFTGRAAHAGTTPMNLRRDALAGAAEFISAVESIARADTNLVATVGQIDAHPGASNVIPARAELTIDIRHPLDAPREQAVTTIANRAQAIASQRGLKLAWDSIQSNPATPCDAALTDLLARAIQNHQPTVPRLPSGAGHDAVALAPITPTAMLFVRCKDGISHHPDESVSVDDISISVAVLIDFLLTLAQKQHG